jgi:hypothetical protein
LHEAASAVAIRLSSGSSQIDGSQVEEELEEVAVAALVLVVLQVSDDLSLPADTILPSTTSMVVMIREG